MKLSVYIKFYYSLYVPLLVLLGLASNLYKQIVRLSSVNSLKKLNSSKLLFVQAVWQSNISGSGGGSSVRRRFEVNNSCFYALLLQTGMYLSLNL